MKEKGVYTGEISRNMLVDAGVNTLFPGHSERRGYFRETDEDIQQKMHKAFRTWTDTLSCAVVNLWNREQGVTMDFIRRQGWRLVSSLTADQAKKAIIATNQSWAIGPGKIATTEQVSGSMR